MFINRIGEENINYQGNKMQIVKYNSSNDIEVEFQDKYLTKVHCSYKDFLYGSVKNPYYPEVYGIGMIGCKYNAFENGKDVREYKIWHSILQRCYDTKTHLKQPTYEECNVSDKWKVYENFYEWVHAQANYKQWLEGNRWTVDKDIICKGNKTYSENYCCLVPENVNALFTKRQNDRGNYPIGVYYYKAGNCFRAQCMNPLLNKRVLIGSYDSPIDAFYAYKQYKEDIIKKIAQQEYEKGNIIEKCFESMMSYEVEITD